MCKKVFQSYTKVIRGGWRIAKKIIQKMFQSLPTLVSGVFFRIFKYSQMWYKKTLVEIIQHNSM